MTAPVELIAFMEQELTTRETSYPTRIRMGSLTQSEAKKTLALMRAILVYLKQKPVETAEESKLVKSLAAIEQIHACAQKNKANCQHCNSIAMLFEELLK